MMNGTSVRLALPPTLQPSANNARWADADDALLTLGAYRSHASPSPWKADMMEDMFSRVLPLTSLLLT